MWAAKRCEFQDSEDRHVHSSRPGQPEPPPPPPIPSYHLDTAPASRPLPMNRTGPILPNTRKVCIGRMLSWMIHICQTPSSAGAMSHRKDLSFQVLILGRMRTTGLCCCHRKRYMQMQNESSPNVVPFCPLGRHRVVMRHRPSLALYMFTTTTKRLTMRSLRFPS